ncbi:hypothetical protein CUMW_187560, partial [Citrus unshiu]
MYLDSKIISSRRTLISFDDTLPNWAKEAALKASKDMGPAHWSKINTTSFCTFFRMTVLVQIHKVAKLNWPSNPSCFQDYGSSNTALRLPQGPFARTTLAPGFSFGAALNFDWCVFPCTLLHTYMDVLVGLNNNSRRRLPLPIVGLIPLIL